MATGDRRARSLALTATGLAAGAGFRLPNDLELWRVAGGRPAAAQPIAAEDPAAALVAALEAALTDGERKQGAHYTPSALADELVARAAGVKATGPSTIVDPACGGGAVLLAGARHLEGRGIEPDTIARDLLWGADLDPLAAAVAEAAIALWSRGTPPHPGHVVAGDPLASGRTAWPKHPADGFSLVVGNPPFQGQLAKATTRSEDDRDRLRDRFGATVVTPYVDTAALFLLAAVDLAAAGGRVSLLQPRSTAAARDAGPVRDALAARARLVDLWAAPGKPFRASVHVCAPVLVVGRRERSPDWSGYLAAADGVPRVALPADARTLGSMASAVAGFRQHFYGLVPHVREAGRSRTLAPLVTSGALGVGHSSWGREPARFSGKLWDRPAVDLRSLARDDPSLASWVDRLAVPKVLVASQTRVVEAAVDREGRWVPCTPVVSVLPKRAADVDLVAAALCAPPVAAWAAARAAGSGLSPGAMRMSAELALGVPLPSDRRLWRRAAQSLADGDLDLFAEQATAMYGVAADRVDAVIAWWHERRPS